MTSIALVGNPNCGKTTLFNALTGAKLRVGNWPGVTVEKLTGEFVVQDDVVEVVDLPGTYSLNVIDGKSSPDTQIACQYIASKEADLIVNIVDANNLERNLYLTMQLIEMQVPLCVVVNMLDLAKKHDLHIDLKALAKRLGCPVLGVSAKSKDDCQHLMRQLAQIVQKPHRSSFEVNYPDKVVSARRALQSLLQVREPQLSDMHAQSLALRCLEEDDFAKLCCPQAPTLLQTLQQEYDLNDIDIMIADSRYRAIGHLLDGTLSCKSTVRMTSYLDKIVLNRVLGVPIFLLVMYLMFVFAINVAGSFQDFFDISSRTLFVDGMHVALVKMGAPAWLSSLLAGGLGVGINTTVTFIPVIGGMFLFLAFLEDSGYMARAAFVIDRLMRSIGLPGKAFVPLIVGFGCNVPAVMAARTLEHRRERIMTIMMAPFMSCGARLAIFAVFTAAFFPHGGHNVVFALYLIGIVFAVLTGFFLRYSLLSGCCGAVASRNACLPLAELENDGFACLAPAVCFLTPCKSCDHTFMLSARGTQFVEFTWYFYHARR